MRENTLRNKFADELIADLLDIIIKNNITLGDRLKLKLRTWVVLYEGKDHKEKNEIS